LARALVDFAPDGLILVDEAGTIEFANPAAESIFGYDRGELVGRSVEVLVPDGLGSTHRSHRARFGATPESRPMGGGKDLMARCADGREIPVEIGLSPVEVAGRPRVIADIRDITRRREAEAARRASEARFRATFHDGPVAMLIGDITGDTRLIIDANRAALDLFARPKEQLIGHSAMELLLPEDAEHGESFVTALKSGRDEDLTGRVRVVQPDGAVLWVQLHLSPLALGNERLLAVVHLLDITAEIRTEAILARDAALHDAVSRIRLASLQGLSRTQGLTMICHAATEVLEAEAAAVYIRLGPDTDDLAIEAATGLGDELAATVSELGAGGAVGTVLRTGRTVSVGSDDPLIVDHNQRTAGHPPIDSIVLAPLKGSEGVVGLLVVARRPTATGLGAEDLRGINRFAREVVITIELATYRQVRRRLELLDDRERIARDMHDMVISRLFATGMKLQASLQNPDQQVVWNRIEEAVEQIDRAINEIRSTIFGLRSAGGAGVRDAVLDVVGEHALGLGFDPVVEFGGPVDDLPDQVVDVLTVVLREALTNVAKHASARHVAIAVSVTDETVTMTVEDDGVGFDLDLHAAQGGAGSGLGNMAARSERIGGRLDIVSTEGEGTTVAWSGMLPGSNRR
jgi:PAS domain S-box-containing protein